MKRLLVTLLLALTGCTASSTKDGVERHYVFGFGVVKAGANPTNHTEIRSVRVLGVYGSSSQIALGYADSTSTYVPDGTTNLLIEVRK